jgi:exopolysaccharide production protein ExoQ
MSLQESRHPARLAEQAFVVFAMLALTTHVLPEVIWPNHRSGDSNAAMQMLYGAVYATAALLLVRRWSSGLAIVLREPWLLALVALAVLSTLWSDAPTVTLRRAFALAGGLALGAYVVDRFSMREWIALLAWALGLSALISYALALFVPEIAIYPEGHRHEGHWRGMFAHKNSLGIHMAFGVLAFITMLMFKRGSRWSWGLVLALALGLIALSGSRSSWLLTLLVAVLFTLTAVWRKTPPQHHATMLRIAVAVFLVGVVLALWLGPHLLRLVDRNVTLTGRVPLWAIVWEYGMKQPWLGHGFAAFWVDWAPAAQAIRAKIRWSTAHAHNGFLDLFLGLGAVGLSLFLASLVRTVIRSATITGYRFSSVAFFSVAFLLLFAVINLVESHIMRPNMLLWQLYVIIALYLSRESLSNASPVGNPAGTAPEGTDRAPARFDLHGPRDRRASGHHSCAAVTRLGDRRPSSSG